MAMGRLALSNAFCCVSDLKVLYTLIEHSVNEVLLIISLVITVHDVYMQLRYICVQCHR